MTPEQENAIPVYQQKWRGLAYSTQPVNYQKAKAAVNAAYAALGKPEPEILFFNGINSIQEALVSESPTQLVKRLGAPLLVTLSTQLSDRLKQQIDENLWRKLNAQLLTGEQFFWLPFILQDPQLQQQIPLLWQVWELWQERMLIQAWEQQQTHLREQILKQPGGEFFTQIGDFFWSRVGEPLSQQIEANIWQPLENSPAFQRWEQEWKPNLMHLAGGLSTISIFAQNLQTLSPAGIDFCISVLGCTHDSHKWKALQDLHQECGWFLQLEKACIICDRPCHLAFDEQNRFHAEGEPAISFADGYSLYFYHGIRLPEKYGRLHPHRWDARWLLTEQNAELRRVLIQGIGYARLCQELQATQLDSWQEYTLLRIDVDVDVEPIYLLKMTCPSTGYIHATRVPPDIATAREAIRWVNWGTDPEEFVGQT